jgi:hypothetical protein
MRHPLWRTAAILLSAVWIIGVGIFVASLVYRQAACTPTVTHMPDGTIMRQACLHPAVTAWSVLDVALYLLGGVGVISLLSWIFLGWPADIVAGFFGYTRDRDGPTE